MSLTTEEKEYADKLFNEKMMLTDKRAHNKLELVRLNNIETDGLTESDKKVLTRSILTGEATVEIQTAQIISLSMRKVSERIGCGLHELKYYYISSGVSA